MILKKNESHKNVELKPKPVTGLAAVFAHNILFILHTFIYLAVSGLLVAIWAVTSPIVDSAISPEAVPYADSAAFFWPLYPIFSWLIGYGFHAVLHLMYTDKVKFLAIIRRDSNFGISFIIHSWFLASVNTLLIIDYIVAGFNATFSLELLGIWGIAFVIQAIFFFTWKQNMNKEKNAIKGAYPDNSERHIKYKAELKIVQFWLLVTHIAYFIVAIIITIVGLFFGYSIFINMVYGTQLSPFYTFIPWTIILGVHALSYILFNFIPSIGLELKTLLLGVIAYGVTNGYLIVIQVFNPFQFSSPTIWIHYPLIIGGIIVAILAFLTFKWDSILPPTIEHIKDASTEGFEEFELKRRAFTYIFWQWTFICHACIYVTSVILIGIELAVLGLSNVLIHVIMGWLILVSFHAACFIITLKKIEGFLTWTAVLHFSIYIPVCIYLVIINVMFSPEILWSVVAIVSWGIAMGFHFLVAYLAKNR